MNASKCTLCVKYCLSYKTKTKQNWAKLFYTFSYDITYSPFTLWASATQLDAEWRLNMEARQVEGDPCLSVDGSCMAPAIKIGGYVDSNRDWIMIMPWQYLEAVGPIKYAELRRPLIFAVYYRSHTDII